MADGNVSSEVNIAEARKPLRLWPGVAAALLLWLVRFGVPLVKPGEVIIPIFGSLIGAVLIVLWWAFLSRAPWRERVGAILLIAAALALTPRILDKSIATAMMGMMFLFYALPVVATALVLWAVATRRVTGALRWATMIATVVVACAAFTMLRANGISGDGVADFAWRWSKTPEQRLVAQTILPPAVVIPVASVATKIPVETPAVTTHVEEPAPVAAAKSTDNWPGFRGPGRDGIVSGTHIKTDWSTSPPVELWRRPIGPAWSSFAVLGDLIYTQEQRGEDELVTCYNATTGKPVWAHRDAARFWEANAGAGPRATPTLSAGRVYTFGATGILNTLDARDGSVIWSRNAATDTSTKTPGWGFASSPLIYKDMVIVGVSGQLAAYDASTGAPRWVGPTAGDSYSSPQLVSIGGEPQIVLMSGAGATSVSPSDGKLLWQHLWKSDTRIMQPAMTVDGDLLMTSGDAMGGEGMRRLAFVHGPSGWTAEQRWTSTGLKSSFSDAAVLDGHVYGFDGGILACLDLKDGKRAWKGGRYGHGQLVLLRDEAVLLVLSEEGEIVLVKAAPDQFTELAKLPSIEGKTWNHPVVTGDRLLVRNGSEMVAYRLALAPR
jgi:outer membrane protein assembly factor BamB